MKMKATLLAIVTMGLLGVSSAQATIFQFNVVLSGANEVPPNASPGTGSVDLEFDDTTNFITITSGFFSGLVSPSTASHIHEAPAGANGSVIIGLTISPPGATAGSLSGGGTLTASQVNSLFLGNLYVNVHSQTFPGGELRGQLLLVPAPGALALLGLAGVVGSRRRRG